MVKKSKFESLQRVFPRKSLFRGKPRKAILWSICGSLLLVVQLINLLLISDLLNNGGRVSLAGGHYDELLQLLPGSLPEHGTDEDSRNAVLENRGILSTVWWSRHTLLGWPLSKLYQNTYILRYNRSAYPTLIMVVILVGFLRGLIVSRIRCLAIAAAMDVTSNLRHNIHRQTLRLGPGDVEDTRSDHVFDLFTVQVERIRDGVTLCVRTLVSAPLEFALLFLFAASSRLAGHITMSGPAGSLPVFDQATTDAFRGATRADDRTRRSRIANSGRESAQDTARSRLWNGEPRAETVLNTTRSDFS